MYIEPYHLANASDHFELCPFNTNSINTISLIVLYFISIKDFDSTVLVQCNTHVLYNTIDTIL